MDERKPSEDAPRTLTDDQIKTARPGRRAFLGTVALGSAAIAAAAFSVGCTKADSCDTDLTRADSDPTDRVRTADSCDTDGTR